MNVLSEDLLTPLPPQALPQERPGRHLSYWQEVRRRFFESRPALVSVGFLVVCCLGALLVPILSSYSYQEIDLSQANRPPSTAHWFGTDDLGRDVFTRVWHGARISLGIGLAAALLDAWIGVLWGSVAAMLGGKVDEVMMRCADLLYGIPYLLVVVMLMVVLGSGLLPILAAMTVTGWINMARITRGEILRLKQQDYVVAAKALGAGSVRILFRHLLPNALGPILVTLTLTIPSAIFIEAFLSFLGLGVQAPVASWGTMASEALPALQYYPWRLFFPAAFISLTMLALNLVGDGMRDAIDPRLRH